MTAQRQDYLGEPVRYEEASRHDPLAKLQQALAAGERPLIWDEEHGWLPSLLEALEAPISTQVLVFSKTSFQNDLIGPERPRAIYFGDEAFIGWIPDAPLMEITAMDPVQGPTFYTVSQDRQDPKIRRLDQECLQCHASSRTRYWPGNLVRSVHPSESGRPILASGTFMTTQDSPLEERWGGWYVSGTHGKQRHMGNVVVADNAEESFVDREAGANITDLTPFFDTERYLSPHSDLVALMVFEHQAQMQNLLARASYQGRRAMDHQARMNEIFEEPDDYVSDTTKRRFQAAAKLVVDHLLFREEALLQGPIAGSSSFAEEFAARGKRDSQGRSLRQLDLTRRLFRFPCSYLIDSDAFRNLPKPVLDLIWADLEAILHHRKVDRDFPNLQPADRKAILEILRETVPEAAERLSPPEPTSPEPDGS